MPTRALVFGGGPRAVRVFPTPFGCEVRFGSQVLMGNRDLLIVLQALDHDGPPVAGTGGGDWGPFIDHGALPLLARECVERLTAAGADPAAFTDALRRMESHPLSSQPVERTS